MPRPSLKDQRSGEILEAYLTCVARFGLDGATQERIASEAGVKRPLLRHYLGNKDQMIPALAAYVVDGFATSTHAIESALADAEMPSDIVDILFSKDSTSDPRLMLAWQALTASAAEYPDMRAPLLGSLSRFLEVISKALSRTAPAAGAGRVRAVAQGIAAPLVNLDAMSPLNPPAEWREDAVSAAKILAASLETAK
ncbi:TetR family transcriptional regulator [Phaeobacter italicus]|uniref:TetR family transcriptional regulator n=1 Tax=Phaeobacter italicus TaxID=481446 RepID=UPI001CD4EA59|nr:TetR family transcriptional regulator [Phaeobacter italicus]MCA0858814.1 TetR family transcriptional regulator [Phaeobacter italicus]